MRELNELSEWRAVGDESRAAGRVVGLVPTMGALHDGHRALIRAAKDHGDLVVATIFVNPRQFNDADDLARYPRTLAADREVAASAGVDVLVVPTLEAMWPDFPGATRTSVHVAELGDVLEGEGRPGHFAGVASVVAKLFSLTGACRAYFGEKDFQQLAVVRQMVRDLSMPVEVVNCPIVRDADGLALSSRNVRLSPSGRARALALSRAIAAVANGPATASSLRALLRATLDEAALAVEYADVVDSHHLRAMGDDASGPARAVVAAVVEGVRLIDNGPVELVKG
ncbi:MAG TPA: pantoate--beta-alanine ligase [Acidimicrobiales bacterium]|nr:MAG: pantoate--beta-alanine ligase [Actinobacteria bacterium 21-64-8]HQT98897.1 pantoate--beta-alanine ligase [Acidimicrobiales bacterium]